MTVASAASGVVVIIAAYQSEATIATAVQSALAQPETAEVFVVDDASRDATLDAARGADDGTGRLKTIRFDENRGPSAARNAAIDASISPLIAVLDADDFFLDGRFARLLSGDCERWDFIADNIAFLSSGSNVAHDQSPIDGMSDLRYRLSFEEFVRHNISRPGQDRAEFGFLKPLMKRSTLERLGLRYRETMRLGEDFILYATALARGAKFELSSRCGYIAIEQPNSLSGRHGAADLRNLATASRSIASDRYDIALSSTARSLLRQHQRKLDAKVRFREFLDKKNRVGKVGAMAGLALAPSDIVDVANGLARDRLIGHRKPSTYPRLLFDLGMFN